MRKGEMASSSSSASSSSFDDNAKDKLQQRLGDVSQVSGNRCQRSLFPLFHISSSHTTPTSLSTKPPLINCIHNFYFCEMWWKYPWRLVNQKVRLTMILDQVWWMVRGFKDDYWTLWQFVSFNWLWEVWLPQIVRRQLLSREGSEVGTRGEHFEKPPRPSLLQLLGSLLDLIQSNSERWNSKPWKGLRSNPARCRCQLWPLQIQLLLWPTLSPNYWLQKLTS